MADLPRFYEPSLKGTPPGCVLGVNVFELSVGGGGPRSLQSSSPSRAIVGFPPWPVSDSPAPKAFSWSEVKVKVAQSCPALCDPTDYTVHGILQARILEWVAFSSSRDLPNPGIKPRSPTLRADSLPAEPPGKPKNIGVDSLSLLQRIFPTQGSSPGLLHCRQILYQLSHQGSPRILEWVACPFSKGSFRRRDPTPGLPHYRGILYQLRYQGSPSFLKPLHIEVSHLRKRMLSPAFLLIKWTQF